MTIIRLRALVAELKTGNLRLKRQVEVLTQHRSLAAGLRGEQIIARIVGAKQTAIVEDHDLRLRRRGRIVRIEVKSSNLNVTDKAGNSLTKRWSWRHVLGNSGGKRCHRVILFGKVDERFRKAYKDKRCAYVLFDISASTAKRLMSKGDGLIQVSSNPEAVVSGSKANEMFTRFQVTRAELRKRYRGI